MRNGLFVGSLVFAAVLSGLLTVGPVAAADGNERVDQIKMTCEEFLALDPDDQQRIAYWVDGYQAAFVWFGLLQSFQSSLDCVELRDYSGKFGRDGIEIIGLFSDCVLGLS